MKPDAIAGEADSDEIFTDKQRHVLDLLIEHKTSKEIARILGISPHTVDQRISLARAKLGVSSRNELAARYQAMQQTFAGQPGISNQNSLNSDAASGLESHSTDPEDRVVSRPPRPSAGDTEAATLQRGQKDCPTDDRLEYRVGPEVFEGSYGIWWRLGAIVATALLLVMIVLGLFAIFGQLSDMLA